MNSPWDEVEQFARERREREATEQQRGESRELFERLDSKVDKLADTLQKFFERSTSGVPPADAGTTATPPDGSAGAGANPPPPPATSQDGGGGGATVEELPIENVRRLDVPRIYTGDDEPAEVSYVDPDSGETKTRRGRRKGRVATYSVEPYEPPPGAEEVA